MTGKTLDSGSKTRMDYRSATQCGRGRPLDPTDAVAARWPYLRSGLEPVHTKSTKKLTQ